MVRPTIGTAYTFQAWAGIQTTESFGSFVNASQRNLTGITGDPNNVDTDGDGILDGVELLFTTWNASSETWTLNPLVPGDGLFDSDEDGIVDIQEFNLVNANPDNGIEHPQMLLCCILMEIYYSQQKKHSVCLTF